MDNYKSIYDSAFKDELNKVASRASLIVKILKYLKKKKEEEPKLNSKKIKHKLKNKQYLLTEILGR